MADNKKIVTNANSFVLNGTLVRDSELTVTQSGFKILNFTIANNYAQKSGESWEQKVNYFDCKVYGARAESLVNILKKGTAISSIGEIRQERWQTQDGKTASRVSFNCEKLEITRYPQNQQNGGNSQPQQGQAAAPSYDGTGSNFPEDVPF